MYFSKDELNVISTTRSLKSISQVAENVTVVTAAEIELMNAHTLADVLNTVTGVQVFMTGGPGQLAPGYIQGSEQRHVTVMIDGVVLNNLGDDVVDLGMVPVQMIEKIEIIKGPASSAWGSSLGGVVNVITKAGSLDHQGNMVSASYGKRNSDDFRAETMGKQDKLGYYITAGRLQSDGLTPHFGVSDNNAYAKLTYGLTDNTDILFTLGYGKDSVGQGVDTGYDLTFDDIEERTYSTLAINSMLSKDLELNVSVRSIQQAVTSKVAGAMSATDKYTDKGYGSSAKLTWKNKVNAIVVGADYDDKTLKSDAITGGEQSLKKSALFANDTISLGKLSITPGIRHDFTSSNGDFTSPSLGLTYGLANNTILRAYAAKGFNIPPLAYTYGNASSDIPNPNLKVETVESYQAGMETAAMKYIWIKLSAFRNEIRDAIEVVSVPTATNLNQAENSGRQRRQGVDIEIKTVPVYHTFLTLGAEFIDAKDLDTGQRVQNIPTHVYDLALHYDYKQSFTALLKGRYINWNADPTYEGKYSSYVFDLNMIKKIYEHRDASLEAFINVHNIFNNDQYLVYIYQNPKQWLEAGLRYTF